eukprot:m.42599 g.42599  ORF g.42599 m.42599 type:complete len:429 (-) comp5735_c0_seq1:520-1806(-)
MALLVVGDLEQFTLACFTQRDAVCVGELKDMIFEAKGVPAEEQRLLLNGSDLDDSCEVQKENVHMLPPLRLLLRLDGGKGGFGSMLRALGAQRSGFETDNIDACRDISGRRLRHINDEKKIKEWLEKKKNDEEDRERKRKEKLEQRTIAPKHTFDRHAFAVALDEQARDVQEAIRKGKNMQPEAVAAALAGPAPKKPRFADDELDVSSSDDDARPATDAMDHDGDVPAAATPLPAAVPAAAAAPVAAKPRLAARPAPTHADESANGVAHSAAKASSPPAAAGVVEVKTQSVAKASSSTAAVGVVEVKTHSETVEITTAALKEAASGEVAATSKDEGKIPTPSGNGHVKAVPVAAPSDTKATLSDGKAAPSENKVKTAPPKPVIEAEPLDLSGFNSIEELEALGLDRLKSALVAANAKVGALPVSCDVF